MDCLSTAIGRDIAGRNTAIVPWSNRLVGRLVAMEVLRQRVVQQVEQLAGRLVEASVGRRLWEWLLEDWSSTTVHGVGNRVMDWQGVLIPCCFRLVEFGIAASTGHHQTKGQCDENHAGNDA